MIDVRQEQSSDVAAIRRVVQEAFGRSAEADLVDQLRSNGKCKLSLVAEMQSQVVGHILFSGVAAEGASPHLSVLGLAPLAVLSEFQRKGAGSALMRRGMNDCRDMGHDAIVVLGHREYYSKFGFFPASRYGLRCEFDVPEDVFMAVELKAGALQGTRGLVRYQPEFAGF
jgi:putative acetyltransferase